MTPEQVRAEEAARRARAEIAASGRASIDRRAAEAARLATGGFSPMVPGGFTLPPLSPGAAGAAPSSAPTAAGVSGPLSAADRQRLYGGTEGVISAMDRRRIAEGRVAPPSDWDDLIAALGAQGGGGGYTPVSVDRSLFQLAQTPEEQAMLERELADIEARRSAGDIALRAGWAQVADTNRRAAEKARSQVLQYGDAAAAGWTDAAQRAQELAAARAQQAGAFEGRQAINVSPTGGAEDFIMFMQSQAPAARQFAEGMQGVLAEDLDWMARTAAGQGEAYSADLQRQANMLAFERAREHNRAVQERIAAERMALADMEFRAASTNAQLAQAAAGQTGQSASQIQGALTTSLLAGDAQGPAVLASILGISPQQALSLYNSAKSSPLGISLTRQAAGN